MTARDNIIADEDWVSDTESVEQDTFNRSNFNVAAPLKDGEGPEVVKATKIDTYKISVPPPAPKTNQENRTREPVTQVPVPQLEPVHNQNNGYTAGQSGDPGNLKQTQTEVIEEAESRNFDTPPPGQTTTLDKLEQAEVKVEVPKKQEILNKMTENETQENLELAQAQELNVPKVVGSAKEGFKGNVNRAPSYAGPPRKGKFDGKYDKEVVEFFTKMNKKSITEQAVEYLNAYWDEVGDQAEFIFSVAHKIFREADMHRQGITLFYLYEEGADVDYPTYLYFYEKLCKFVQQNPKWRQGQFEKSAVYEVKTAIKHKKELQEKVDVNFDGRISFLEFLLFQYNTFSNPAGFMERARRAGEEHPAVVEARLALQKVNERIKAYEAERARLEEGAKKPGVKGLTFKHQLTMLDGSRLGEELNQALITAEAAVRLAIRKFAPGGSFTAGAGGFTPQGALWWMQRDLEEKKKFGKRK